MNVSHKYFCSEVIAWERFVDLVGLAPHRGEDATTARSAGSEDQTHHLVAF